MADEDQVMGEESSSSEEESPEVPPQLSTTQRARTTQTSRPVKFKAPDEYHGDRGELETFLLQYELYIWHHSTRFRTENEVMFAVTYLRGKAFRWIQPFLRDFLDHKVGTRKPETLELFSEFSEFKRKIRRVFGDIDEERTAERDLINLRQRASAATYAAQFQGIASHTTWDDPALTAIFYKGLKDEVKDDLARGERPADLQNMISKAIIIHNRIYERRMEKKERHFTPVVVGRPKQERKPYYGLQPMELDTTTGRPNRDNKSRSNFKGHRGQGQAHGKKCFNCGKEGHFARNCRQPKNNGQSLATSKTKPEKKQPSQRLAATEHKSMSWTSCFDDDCHTHLSDKEGSGWYPKPPRKQRAIQAMRMLPIEEDPKN